MTEHPISDTTAADLERAVLERGRALLDAVQPERLVTLSPEWWQDRLMEWASEDPDFRVKLLRFVDVLPALRSSRAIADHVRQYFREHTPAAVRIGSSIGRRGIFRPALSRVVRQGVFSMASRFIIAPNPRKALPRLRELVESGTAFTIDLLGEATLSDREADAYRDRYLSLLEALGGEVGRWDAPPELRKPNVSIKLSALTPHFEPASPESSYESLRRRLAAVVGVARRMGAFVNIDTEQYRYRNLIYDALDRLVEDDELRAWPDLGIVVQAYLEDSPEDIERLAALARRRETPITVRLVKGAYWDEEMIVARQNDYPVPVFEHKSQTDASFERCTALLVAAYPHLRPAFATHNPRSIAQAMVRVERAGIPAEHVEFQMLFGMAEGLRGAVRAQAYRTRVYVPAGEIIPGMGYLVRRLLENTSNESWVVSKHEGADPEVALRAPVSDEAPVLPDREGFRNHPPLQLYRPGAREAMQEAIRRVSGSFGHDHPLVVGGKSVKSHDWLEVRCPAAPSTLMGRVSAATSEHVDAAVASARRGFPRWRDAGAGRRAEALRRAADLMASARTELAAVMIFESGKPWREADGDVTEAIDALRYNAAQAERLGKGIDLTVVPGETNRYVYEPRGVVGVISPWNFPLAIPCGMTSAALAAGNTVVLKPAHQAPIIAGRLVSILHEAGVPDTAVHYLPGRGSEAGQALVEHPDVDMIAFTGGNAVGRAIVSAAAEVRPGQRGLKKVLAELGGKNAIIVDDDADLDLAVEGVVRSAFGYAGQKCSAASRVIVVGSAYEEFRDRLAAAVESLPVGPPEDPYTVVPPVISAEARAKIEGYVAIGDADGELVAKGSTPAGEGHYVAPHVFEGLPTESKLACEEVFGPVLAMFRADRFEDALDLALDSAFALTGGVYSRNPRHIALARERFRVGNLYLNRHITGAAVGRQPFGGFAMSGTDDKAGGPDYVQQFTLARVVTENTMRRGFAPARRSESHG